MRLRRKRKDAGKKRGKYRRALGIAGNVLSRAAQVGAGVGLVAGSIYGVKQLARRGYLPDYLGNASHRAALKEVMLSNAHNSTGLLIPAATVAAGTVGLDLAIDRRRDLPVTRRVRRVMRGDYSMPMMMLSEFGKNYKEGRKKHKKKSPGLLSWKRKASYAGHLAKGTAYGAAAGGALSGIATSPVPVLIPAATAIGAADGAIKGAVLGSATYGVRKGLQERKSRRKR